MDLYPAYAAPSLRGRPFVRPKVAERKHQKSQYAEENINSCFELAPLSILAADPTISEVVVSFCCRRCCRRNDTPPNRSGGLDFVEGAEVACEWISLHVGKDDAVIAGFESKNRR